MTASDDEVRYAPGAATPEGHHVFSWQLTPRYLTDPVILELPPEDVLPVIFVPGIMGSNLRNKHDAQSVWKLNNPPAALNVWKAKDKPGGLLLDMASASAGDRQKMLHPERVEVDPGGAVPKKTGGSIYDVKQYVDRGWGEVGEGSYHGFLLWLEYVLNGQGYNPARWRQFYYTAMSALPKPGEKPSVPTLRPGIRMAMRGLPEQGDVGPLELDSSELLARARFRMPVYACGYNWLASNVVGAERLRQRILDVIKANNHAGAHCSQVIVITHSMGGLVARACQQLNGMQEAIAGMVHGVMPSVGAAVAYRRCKIGMRDEDAVAGMVIGSTGQEVTAVFAQAPGALQLLPTKQYRSDWLTIDGPSGKSLETEPSTSDPYKDIYLREDRWWGLIRKEWLNPPGGTGLKWGQFTWNIGFARKFHDSIQNAYHPNTYVFYGKDQTVPSFEGVHWKIQRGTPPDDKSPPSPDVVSKMGFADVRDDGSNPLYVGGKKEVIPVPGTYASTLESSYWELVCGKQDGGGDGTVPISSGAFPLHSGGDAIQQQLGIAGVEHEPACHQSSTRTFALYALQKIAAKAKVSA